MLELSSSSRRHFHATSNFDGLTAGIKRRQNIKEEHVSAHALPQQKPAAKPGTEGLKIDATGEATSSLTPELVIALCGPIGSPLHETATQVENTLKEFNYKTVSVRLSNLIRLNAEETGRQVDEGSKYVEILSLIAIGDELRKSHGADVLAKLAIAKISADRRQHFGAFDDTAAELQQPIEKRISNQRICHVIDSIKNTAELDLLRLIYGEALFAVGVFSPLEVRRQNLERPGRLSADEIDKLIDTDSGEEFSHGQSVRDTFPRCDFFLRVDQPIVGPAEPKAVGQISEKARRFFDLIFKSAVITPTTEETAMYAASSAARNSACLSRQVGAAVTSEAGELLAIGWNDVPQSRGGLYGKPPTSFMALREQENTLAPDERCFVQPGGKCHNEAEKKLIADKVVESLVAKGVLTEDKKVAAVQAIISDGRVKDLIEFSRAVHAEMHAVLGASRVAGDRVLGGKIFVTTYPCHSCARHLVAAGIAQIHYIEPYRKSLATKLHADAITESTEPRHKVQLLQFDGIAPRRFIELFEGGSRKKSGVLGLLPRLEARPSTHVSLKAIPRLEEVVVAEIQTKSLKLHTLLPREDYHDGHPTNPSAA
jgi:deoxycytidylate deaminase